MRVQIPAYTDRWMMGDRYGDLLKITTKKDGTEIAHVKMDISKKTVKVLSLDCTYY